MKKIFLTLLINVALLTAGLTQTVDDALRYSQLFYTGTARFMSMGGAFTALGGDLSSLSQNPAGLGVFRSSELTITPQLFHIKSTADFNGTKSTDYLYNFNLGQAGIVANIINKNTETGLISLNFGYSYNRTNNLNQSILMETNNTNSSLTDYWVDRAKGFYHNELSILENDRGDAFLAYDTWLIDTLSGSSTSYGTVYSNYGDNLPSVYGQTMRRLITNEGSTAEHALSIGGNYSNKFFFGATFAISRLDYQSKYEHLESTDAVLPSKFTSFNYVYYSNDLGTGYSLKIGAIYKPIEILRLGFAFHSPVLYRIDESVSDNISSYFSDRAVPYTSQNQTTRYNYALTTPFRVLLGAALQLKKLALLSADYEFIDYSTARFSETGDGFNYTDKNLAIKNGLKSVSNIRLGAEVRLSSIYLRGGYSYYGKAYKSGDLNDNLKYNSISLGLGFREQNIFADFGFTTLLNSQKYILYDSSAGTPMSDIKIDRNLFTVTFGYKFGY